MANATPYTAQAATSKQITDIMSTIGRVEFALSEAGGGGGAIGVGFSFVRTFGTTGTANGEFRNPQQLALDTLDKIYVADMTNSRIQKFTPIGVFISKFGGPGSGPDDFGVLDETDGRGPRGVAIDSNGNIWTSDVNNSASTSHRVQKFNSSFVFQFRFGSVGPSSADGGFDNPNGLAVLSNGHILVVDTGNDRIQEFDSNGNFVSKFGTSGPGDGQFDNPVMVSVDDSDNIYVADNFNSRVQKFSSNGTFLGKFGSVGDGNEQFAGVAGVSLDSSGNIFVSDRGNDRLQSFNPAFSYVAQIGSLDNPQGSAVSSTNILSVPHFSNDVIRQYSLFETTGPGGGTIIGNPLLDAFGQTNWKKYGNKGTSKSLNRVALPTPEVADNALMVPIPKDQLQIGERYDPFNIRIVRDMRTAMEALAASGFITNIATGNTLTWDFTTDDDLYKSATNGKLAAMGRTTGTHSWTRSLGSMSGQGTRILDADIAEMRLCADFLEACVDNQ